MYGPVFLTQFVYIMLTDVIYRLPLLVYLILPFAIIRIATLVPIVEIHHPSNLHLNAADMATSAARRTLSGICTHCK